MDPYLTYFKILLLKILLFWLLILVAKHLMAWARRPRRIYSLDAQALRPAEHLIFAARI